MSKMSSLNVAVSGMQAAQAGLYVTGHNMANSSTIGYVRQQVLQSDARSNLVGINGSGALQVGLGTNISSIRQIRDKFLDISYRQEVSRLSFYDVKYATGIEISSIIGEMEGEYKLQSVLHDMFSAFNELMYDPKSVETRGNFITICDTFVDKVNNAFTSMRKYQTDLNEEVKQSVANINQLLTSVDYFNKLIAAAEASGDNANDYRDMRNNCLDSLSGIIDITYSENANGTVDIMTNGKELLVHGVKKQLGLRYSAPGSDFVEPVFTTSSKILEYDETGQNAVSLFNYNKAITSTGGKDKGSLLGLIVSRGLMPANYTSYPVTIPPATPVAMTAPPALTAANSVGLNAAFVTAYNNYVSVDYPAYQTAFTAYLADPDNTPMPVLPDPPSLDGYTHTSIDPDFQIAYNDFNAALDENVVLNRDSEAGMFLYYRNRFNMTSCMIPQSQMQLDTMVNSIVKFLNDAFAPVKDGKKDPNAPYGTDGSQYTELFVRTSLQYADRFNANGTVNGENKYDAGSLYTVGNIQINPLLMNPSGYDKIALSDSGAESDPKLINRLIEKWGSKFIVIGNGEPLGVNSFYRDYITNAAIETQESANFLNSQMDLVTQIDYKKQSISGVSMDEEMTNMLKYQHAYNASARMINIIDGMIDKIVNGTGRVGL